MNKKAISILFMGAVLITGCGGGGGSNSGGGSGGGTSGVTLNTAPTAVLSSSQTSADKLAAEIQGGSANVASVASSQTFAQVLSTLTVKPATSSPNAPCSVLSLSSIGTGTFAYDTNLDTAPRAVGSYANVTFNTGCTFSDAGTTIGITGSIAFKYTRYNSTTDFAFTVTYTNVSISYSGNSQSLQYGPFSGTYNYDQNGSTITTSSSLANGGATNVSSNNITASGSNVTIVSATYVYDSAAAGGVIQVVFDNWTYDTATGHAISGTITVTGANGDSAQIVATGSGYTVTYTINGVQTVYTVSY